ncbi:MAG: ROK family protein [Phycisphaeraceae bacterium]|nr:ROK family protein [Phycisphaeraceae bacterium]
MAKDNKFLIGVDLGGTNIQAGIVTVDGKVIAKAKKKTKAEGGTAKVIDRVCETCCDAMEEAGLSLKDILALGIGAPGAVDSKAGIVIEAVNLRWNNYPLAKTLKNKLNIPVVVDNDVNVGAWGEYQVGAGKKQDNMLAVFIGTGIGGGLILNGDLYQGTYGTAGEIGHVVLRSDAPLGRRTLENLASRTAIVNLITNLIKANHPSIVTDLCDGDLTRIRSKVLKQAVAEKDELVCRVVKDACHYVGVAVAGMVTMLSLPCVVLGGGLTEAMGKEVVEWTRKSFEDTVFPSKLKSCKIVEAQLADDAGLVGAALLAASRLKA